MNTYDEKISLLLEMIAFSTVDGNLHKREYDFLAIIANELKISLPVFKDLFHQELPQLVMKTELERIQQFYRLALLMHSDGMLHGKEETAIRQIAVNMGLNPSAIKRILEMMKKAPFAMIEAEVLLNIFQEQNN